MALGDAPFSPIFSGGGVFLRLDLNFFSAGDLSGLIEPL
jgi:hypothetical protein